VNLHPFDLIYAKRPAHVSLAAEIVGASVTERIVVALAVLALACGVALRFAGLGHKLYTNDEATTSVHVSGHTLADFLGAAAAGQIKTAADALRYQQVDPATGPADVVRSLAVEDPQHPPLFYVLERRWEGIAGASVAARRSLPALFGVLGILTAYAFGCTLVDSRRYGLVLAALVAVSPFHILYAQQAREYSLWTVFVFASSAVLLRALRPAPDRRLWAAFAALTAAGLYTDVLYLYTLLAQGLYVVIAYRRDFRRGALPFAGGAGLGLVAFAPWLAALVTHAGTVTNNAYLGAPLPAQALALKWLFNLGAVFYDLDFVWHASALIVLPILALAAFGIAQLLRRRPGAARYVLALGLVTLAAFLVPDLVRHESRSTAARYLIPTWLALEAAVAFAVWTLLRSDKRSARVAAVAVLAFLLGCGIVSGAVSASREVWWGDGSVASIGPIARIVRTARPPVTVIFRDDQPIWNFAPMELANEVSPETRLQLLTGDALPVVQPSGGTDLLLDPSARLRKALVARGARLSLLYAGETAESDDLRAQRREASRARAERGFVDIATSLWLVSSPKDVR